MRTIMAVTTALMLATPATAQFTNCTTSGPFANCMSSDGTITNCNRVGNTVNCSSMGGPQPPSYENGVASNGIANFVQTFRENRARSHVRKALKAGDCATATRESLNTGDMGFAQQVRAHCESR